MQDAGKTPYIMRYGRGGGEPLSHVIVPLSEYFLPLNLPVFLATVGLRTSRSFFAVLPRTKLVFQS